MSAPAPLELCAHPSPFAGGEPCPRERDHAGGHVYWTQTQPHRKRGRNGVLVIDESGATLLHATFDGAATAADLCALLAIRDAVAARGKRDGRG